MPLPNISIKFKCVLQFAGAVATLFNLGLSESFAEEALGWVQKSRIDIRSQADLDSLSKGKANANSQMVVLSRKGDVCEVRLNDSERGFVSCQALGDKPLNFAEVSTRYLANGSQNPNYSPPLAFWMAPSMASLFEAGSYYQQTLLTPEQQSREQGYLDGGGCCAESDNPPKLDRYSIPEFDAMKKVLDDGIVAPASYGVFLESCTDTAGDRSERLQEKGGSNALASTNKSSSAAEFSPAVGTTDACTVDADLVLPDVSISFFTSPKDLAPGSASIERISAHFGIVERGRVVGTPKWELDYDMYRYTGAWDIGEYQLTLSEPIFENVIGRSGLVSASQWTPQITVTPSGPSEGCGGGLSLRRRAEGRLPDYAEIKDALVWFQSTKAIPNRKVVIKTSIIRGSEGRRSAYEIDIDQDGVADLVKWDIWNGYFLSLRLIFANIAGVWYLLDKDQYTECT